MPDWSSAEEIALDASEFVPYLGRYSDANTIFSTGAFMKMVHALSGFYL